MKVSIIIPTYNAGKSWEIFCQSLLSQVDKDNFNVFIVDSSSSDNTVMVTHKFGFNVTTIAKEDFNHGGTRNLIANKINNSDFILFFTQDVEIISFHTIKDIINIFEQDLDIAAVCGRQIPHDNANPLAIHARLFNYPKCNKIISKKDISQLGLKAAFMSNSFAAYRTEAFFQLGGFPNNTILAEDMYLAARFLLAGYKTAYAGNIAVKHSHNYTVWQEFKRYFDIGVFHATEPWIQHSFGGAGGEGANYLKSEFYFLLKTAPLWIPQSFLNNLAKFIGYKLGKKIQFLPKKLRVLFSMHRAYWK